MTGRLTALIGTSSVGKTSVARELQLLSVSPELVVGLDHFFQMFPHHWAGHPRGPGPGFWYEDRRDADSEPEARIRFGVAGERLLAGMRAAVCALLDAGNDVILDEMPLDETIVPAWRAVLEGYTAFWVRLTAPLAVAEQRERERSGGRHPGNARGHLLITAQVEVDLSIDTGSRSPRDVAAAILANRPF